MAEYNLFISHSWNYSDAYEKLCLLLDKANYFKYKNYSIPKDNPFIILAKTETRYRIALKSKIRDQMKYASVVLIMAGVYSSYSDSINLEIEVALELEKPILAIEPWGSEKTSKIVKEKATKIVSWSTSSIVDAIIEISI
ncbi:MAG: TIR domain-containing protein [Candidatus Izemoplasmatales bacterium]|nr:TIR domain-containing protein [Candidatus Izemoplasmatales bacterium]